MPHEPLFTQFGIELVDVGPGRATLGMTVRDDMLNQQGVCHGGILFTLADSAVGIACNSHNERALTSNCAIEFMRPARVGDRLSAIATEIQRGRRTGLYDVRVTAADGSLVALLRGRSMTVGGTVIPADAQ